jgi:thymidylate synthase (FAD)
MYRDGAFRNFNEVFTDNLYYRICSDEGIVYITTNYRYIIENNLKHWLDYLCEPTEHHEKRITVKFICDRGVSHEFVRHRVFSFAQESTRYCNYSKDKFDNEITYILPPWIRETDIHNFYENSKGDNFLKYNKDSLGGSFIFLFNLEELEETYITLVKEEGWKPQEARAILPNSLKTELVMTGFVSDWEHFFLLRTPVNAHPQARELAIPLKEEFIKRNLI